MHGTLIISPTSIRTTDRETLQAEALISIEYLGHSPGAWFVVSDSASFTKCQYCGAEAWVDTHPAPNGIEISGEAVALTCPR